MPVGIEESGLLILDDGFFQNPYPVYDGLRAAGGAREARLPNGQKLWIVTRFEEGRAALSDPRLSKRLSAAEHLFERHFADPGKRWKYDNSVVEHMLNSDPPDHSRLRRLVGKAFTTRRVAALRPRIEEIGTELIDRMAEQETVDLWALRSLGVRQVLAPCAVGSLRPGLGPGSIVVPDQLVDRTTGRIQTYYDEGAVHVSFADPYCPTGRTAVLEAAAADGAVTDGGTMVVVEGPRFSTRAESQGFAAAGWSLVNMTGHPEAVLARELALCYTAVALVTDYDAGVEAGAGVGQEEVFRVFAQNVERLKSVVLDTVGRLPESPSCACPAALDGMPLPFQLP